MPPPDQLLGQNVGGYIVEEPLGEGAMGLVYRARHPLLNRHFAIKVLKPEVAADAGSSSQFVREAQTLSSLKHPSIIDIVGFGPMPDGRQYMVMEFLLGKTLEAELVDEGRLDPSRALQICDEILDALSAAHSVEVIHRDLKPSNVFLEKVSGGREVVKLLDFGLAKQRPAALRSQGAGPSASESGIAGTPDYISPEQSCGEPASVQSDLYSFGVMLFRMLTGSLPFTTDDDAPEDQRIIGLMKKHVYQAPPTLHDGAPGVHFPEGLEVLVADLLKKKPAERPSSAETTRKRLRQVYRTLQQEATQARPNPLLAVPAVAKTRSPAVPLLAGAFGLVVLLVGAAWWWAKAPAPQAAPVAIEAPPVAQVAAPVPVVEEVRAEGKRPDEQVVLEELAELSSIHKPRKQAPVAASVPSCVPDAAWKKRARADLNELVTRAARLSPELSLWAADREGPLSSAIETAMSDRECGAVKLQLATFKDKVTRN